MSRPDLAVFGNLILDDVVRADGSTRFGQPGGAALYAALGARLWGTGVGIVSVVGDDYPAEVLDALGTLGIDLSGVRQVPGPTLRTWLLYEGRRRRVVHRLDGPTHSEVSPGADDLPGGWAPRACHLAPMPLDVQQRLAAALAAPGRLVSLDPYELVREHQLPRWRELLAGVDLFLLGEDEMELPGGLDDPEPALRRLAAGGRPSRLLYKQGARGGILYDVGEDSLRRWRPRADPVVDPTGAGDAFAGGLLAGLLAGGPFSRALERGLVSATFALGAHGPEGLLAATGAEAERHLRHAEMKGMVLRPPEHRSIHHRRENEPGSTPAGGAGRRKG